MKPLLLLILLTLSFTAVSQNMFYFERQSPYSDFTSGNGQVELKEVGVSSTITILVKYKRLIAGTPTSTGWIEHSGAIYNDVYDDTIRAVGVYYGDTLIQSKHLFDVNNYEVVNISTTGFDQHGVYDMNAGNPWEIIVTFAGPTSNSDAEVSSFFGSITSVNNVLTLDNSSSGAIPYPVFGPILFNNSKSMITIEAAEINYPPNHQTSSFLNAYIPRVINRPNTVNDCGGEITFERLQMVNDINLEYSINGAAFTSLTNDNFSGICAYDTIKVLGFSPSVLIGDTLVETQYVLRSADSLGQYDFDMAEVGIALNLNNTSDYGCENTLTFTDYQGNTVTAGDGLLFNDLGEALGVSPQSSFNEYGDICQTQYVYSSNEYGVNPSPLFNYYVTSYFTITILDENNETHGNPVNTNIDQYFSDSLSCTSDLVINRVTSPEFLQGLNYSTLVSNYPNSYEIDANSTISEGTYTDSLSINGLCPGMYVFSHNKRKKFTFVTDSLQQLDVSYRSLIGDGINDNYMTVPEIDTLKLYYEECNNDYSQPFTTVDYHKTNSMVSTVSYANTGFNIEEFNSSFDLTQGANSFYLHERPVTMMDYSYYPNYTPYYIITELYCETSNKSTIKRRKLIIAPDGTVTDLYNGATSLDQENTAQEFSVYPNPSTDEITIESNKQWESFTLVNTSGKVVLRGQNKANMNKVTLNINHLDEGVYILKINSAHASSTKLVVKQ